MTVEIAGIDVSRETFDRLKDYESLIKKWNPKINLVAKSTMDDVWDRHIIDSAQVFGVLHKIPENWVDIGSGGGFPGLVVATIAKEHYPNAKFTLIESDARKSTFLRTVSRELELNCMVIAKRIEAVPSQDADVISARALAPLQDLFSYVIQHLKPNGRAVFQKGQSYQDEIEQARKKWKFDVVAHPSLTDKRAKIIEAWNIEPIN